jgi:hypothetical protein
MALYQFVQADFLDKSLNAMKTLLQEELALWYVTSQTYIERKQTTKPLRRRAVSGHLTESGQFCAKVSIF